MKIILDTCILNKDHYLSNPKLENLCVTAHSLGIEVMLPEVVLTEMRKHFLTQAKENIAGLDSAVKKFNRLADPIHKNVSFSTSMEDLLLEFEKTFHSRMQTLNIKAIPLPIVPHKDILSRYANDIKPFNGDNKGYRDTLIWESIIEEAQRPYNGIGDNQIIFVTSNTKDFCTTDEKLHPDLQQELQNIGFDPGDFKIFKDLDQCIALYVTPTQTALLDDLKSDLQLNLVVGNQDITEYLEKEVTKDVESILTDSDRYQDFDLLTHQVEIESPEITDINIKNINITDLHLISNGKFILNVDLKVNIDLDGYLTKSEYWLHDAKLPVNVINEDWNEWYMYISTDNVLSYRASLIINPEFTAILSSDLISQYNIK